MNKFKLRLTTLALTFCTAAVALSGVMMEGFYANVPSGGSSPWWWDHLAEQAQSLSQAGFTAIWLPPPLKGASGGYSEGYDPFDDYDLGSKNQKGTIPTHYGTRTQLERCCALFRANGIDVYEDIVDNQRNGDDGYYNFNYDNWAGTPNSGRFPKRPLDFHPNVPQDPDVPLGNSENFFEFGRDLAPINSPREEIANGLNASGDWLTKALDLQGYRLDDVKGISTDWLNQFLTYGSMNGKFAVGEFYDDNFNWVESWIQSLGGKAQAFDFALRDMLKQMCDDPSSFNMASLDHAGLTGIDPTHSVTFVENHDTDTSDPIYQNKALAYAYILTSEGYPCVFYRDYSTDPGCYGMKNTINNLIWIHEKLASGTTLQRWKNQYVFAYERLGGSHLLVGLNNLQAYNYTITCQTGFGAYVHLHDYTGHAPDVWTDGGGNVTITIPPGAGGNGYVCYAPAGISGSFTPASYFTTQEYAGAMDLDIAPATQFIAHTVATCDIASGETTDLTLWFNTANWGPNTKIRLEVDSPVGRIIAQRYFYASSNGQSLIFGTQSTGDYTFKIESYLTNVANPSPSYWLDVHYLAPKQ